MPNKRTYMRKFIILEPTENMYYKDKPKGYAKIEVRNGKGKIFFNVEKLKDVHSSNKAYKGYLLSNQKERVVQVDIGTIVINDKGKGSVQWKFDPNSVGGTGLSIDNFNTVLVRLYSVNGEDKELKVPLVGYINEKDDSLDRLAVEIKRESEKDRIEKMETEIEEVDEEEVEKLQETGEIEEGENIEEVEDEEKIENLKESQEFKEEEKIDIKEIEDDIEELREDLKEIEEDMGEDEIIEDESDELEKDETEEVKVKKETEEVEVNEIEDVNEDNSEDDEIEKSNNEENNKSKYTRHEKSDRSYSQKNMYPNNMNKYYEEFKNRNYGYPEGAKNYTKQLANYTKNILRFFERVEPFRKRLSNYTWWKIEYDRKSFYRGFLPFYNYIVNMYYPYPFMPHIATCPKLIKKYGHYIFGIVKKGDDIKYYVYGIPGRFTRDEQPYRGMTGFKTWIESRRRGRERIGYWLLHIDPATGRIVTPLSPTPPR
ncbi:hypothetical protein [Thermohalobacter berrensis]|uniref:DUF7922 domain-containing protein n=1 Tax=Thermohalobacter berrensis TaxID=99594 RepID=A0A419T0C7_9FIRM|nr:hypothetical protein [Thermohalobacter berrensis]RKD30903.1 hypothetical protein BET03_13170 [Thermohalobacter berrensis]